MTAAGVARTGPSVGRSVAATSFGFALIQLDVTIVNVALPAMGADLGAGTAGLQWMVDAYALVFAAMLLSAGYLSDFAGARRVYLVGMAVFAAASLACGLAPGTGSMIAFRALQGLGAAAMLPSSLALLNHACADDPCLRGWAIGWWTSSASVALASGPVIGGLLVHWIGWRSIFLVNLPLGVIGAAMARSLPETAVRAGRRIDVPGQVLCIVALAALTGAVIEAGPRGATDPMVLAAAVLAVLASVGFVIVERRVGDPMLPARMFAAPLVPIALVFGAVVNLAYYGIIFVLSLYLQTVLGYDSVHAGLAFLPLTATFLIVNALSGWIAGRYGARWPMVAGALVAALGYGLLLRLGAATSFAVMLPAFVLMPVGMGFAVPAMIAGVLASVDAGLSGTVSAALNASRQAGGVVGVALFGAYAGSAVTGGLHAAALTAAILMTTMAGLVAFGLRRRA